MQELMAGTLSMEAIRLFWRNWAYYVFEINNLIACAYQRHIGFFKQHPDLLASFSAKVADEYIHPRPPGHVLIVLEQGEIFGLTRDDMIACEMLAECRGILEFKRGLLHEGTMLEWWASMATEEPIGYWAGQWREALTSKYGLESAKTRYFKTHEEADLEEHEGVMGHGQFNRGVVQRIIESGIVNLRPGFSPNYVVRTCVDFYGLFFRGIYERVKGNGA
jgi:pyrroloquinoline quinone (PQQ) biosynthesis protein C